MILYGNPPRRKKKKGGVCVNYAQRLYWEVLPELRWLAFQTISFQFRNGLCPVCHIGSEILCSAAKHHADNPSDL